MGKPEFKSPRHRNPLTLSRPLSRSKTTTLRPSVNIKVVVRVRPPNEKEQQDNYKRVVKIIDEQVLVFDPKVNTNSFFYHGVEQKGRDMLHKANKDLQFMFDRIFGFDSTNEEVFENTTKSLIQSLMDGCNCSVFAYGATGAGKTHTMLGNSNNPGITFLTMAELFKATEELQHERSFELGITYLEVYNELVQDLLNPGSPLQLRDDGKYGVMVAGIKVHKINKPEELFALLAQGNNNRTQHPTDANAESSRSHAVFQVYIQMEYKSTREVRAAKLSMIDLAGSERGSATGFGGARFTEGANINKSLLALGNCINSLADGQKYVPYRDSKLTRLLKDSLGGNCQTVMIANVSPSSMCYEDTYNTLKYATRAKKIKSNVKRNVVNVELHVGEYVKIVEDLKKELEKVKSQLREKICEKKVDPILSTQLLCIIEDRKKLLERMYNVECSENMVLLRRHLKEDADSRLSFLISSTEEKEEAHRRLGNTCERFLKQEGTLKKELVQMEITKQKLEVQTREFVKSHPEVQQLAEIENEKLAKAETQYKVDLVSKKCALLEEELKSRAQLLENTCKMLKSCFNQLRGHGFLTDNINNDYKQLVSHLQDRKNITWTDPIDSGLSSIASASSSESEIMTYRPPTPLKVPGPDLKQTISETISPNATFVAESQKVRVCANERMVKVAQEAKRPTARGNKVGMLKENKVMPTLNQKFHTAVRRKVITNPEIIKKRPFRT